VTPILNLWDGIIAAPHGRSNAAYADRSGIGDPDFVKVPVGQLTSRAYAAKGDKEIRMDKAQQSTEVKPVDKELLRYTKANLLIQSSHVVDEQRNAVSLTLQLITALVPVCYTWNWYSAK